MESRKVLFDQEALKRVQAGIDEVANTVKITLGPRGRNVILNTNPSYELPTIINDGVRIAREVNPVGEFEKTGATLIKKVAERTDDEAGDGTTTSAILMQQIVKMGMQQIVNGADPVQLREDIETATEIIIKDLNEQSIPTTDLKSLTSVATISCGNEKLGKIVADMVHKLGSDGVIAIDEAENEETISSLSEGLELRGGVQLPIFITHPSRQLSQLDNVPIFVTDHDLTNGVETIKIMEAVSAHGHKEAVVIANSISGEAMRTAVINRAQGKFTLIPIRVQAWGETGQDLLRDVAAVTGATFFAKEEGFKLPLSMQDNYDFNHFGHADRLIATKDRTTIIGGGGDREARIEEVEAQIPNIKVAFRKEQVKERVARLKSGVGTISIGGIGDTDRKDRSLRIEDAIKATKAALEYGIIAGGGSALYRASKLLDSPYAGFATIKYACEAPIRQMGINSGVELSREDLDFVAERKDRTINFINGSRINGINEGIIDPVKVVTTALRNASAEARLFLTSGAAIVTEKPNHNDPDVKA